MKLLSVLEDILLAANRLRFHIATIPTCMLVNFLLAFIFLSGGIGVLLIKYIPSELKDFAFLLLLNALLLLGGCIGVLGIIRKEGLCHFGEWIYNLTQGVPAVLMGFLIVLMTWGLAAYITVTWIVQVFSR